MAHETSPAPKKGKSWFHHFCGGKHFIEDNLENHGILEVYGVPDVRCGFIPAKN